MDSISLIGVVQRANGDLDLVGQPEKACSMRGHLIDSHHGGLGVFRGISYERTIPWISRNPMSAIFTASNKVDGILTYLP